MLDAGYWMRQIPCISSIQHPTRRSVDFTDNYTGLFLIRHFKFLRNDFHSRKCADIVLNDEK